MEFCLQERDGFLIHFGSEVYTIFVKVSMDESVAAQYA
jgi:hypothetical protein